ALHHRRGHERDPTAGDRARAAGMNCLGYRLRATGYPLKGGSRKPEVRSLLAVCWLIAACAAPSRNLSSAPAGKAGCAILARWVEEKLGAVPQREGESSPDDDTSAAVACFRRENDDGGARAAL